MKSQLFIFIFILTFIQVSLCYKCPDGWKKKEDTDNCSRLTDVGRGAGYGWQFGDDGTLKGAKRRCEKKHSQCEKYLLIYYPKCPEGYSPSSCCICEFKHCPSGYYYDGFFYDMFNLINEMCKPY